MLPKKSHSLKDKNAGIEPDKVLIAKDGKKRKGDSVRRSKITSNVTDNK